MREIRASQKETDKQLKKTDARFNSQWGKLVESLVEGKLVEILNERGIKGPKSGGLLYGKRR